MNTFALDNCDIYTGDEILTDSAVVVRDGQISELVPSSGLAERDVEIVNLEGMSVSPGFLDLQVNGGGDKMFNEDPSVDCIRRIMAGHRRFGTTDILPTFITGPYEGMRSAANAVDDAIRAGEDGVLGVHFEGPLLSESKLGVHDAAFAKSSPDDELNALFAANVGRSGSTVVTLAPEVVPAGYVRMLVDKGIRVAAGHTKASAAEVREAIDEGLSLGTHVWNAMSALGSREAGAVGALLGDSRVWCDFVADGHHVSFETLALSLRSLAQPKAILVTDAMHPVGGEKAGYTLGPYEVRVTDGKATTAEGVLAGSVLDLATAIRNMVQHVGVPKDEALRMATLYPAEFLGIDSLRGRIAPGYPAHLAIFDNEVHVSGVVYDGKLERF